MHFEKARYRVFHETSNVIASLVECLEFHEKLTFAHPFWINSAKSK